MSISLMLVLFLGCALGLRPPEPPGPERVRTPVLVELFTSEGCSSCPPADAFLNQLDQQPLPEAEVIVLSEHVDYWNHIGWKDPYSSAFYSERQSAYAQRLGLGSVYTPQMVVDGVREFVGSDSRLAAKALNEAAHGSKIALRLSALSVASNHILQAHLETDVLPASLKLKEVEIYAAIALNHGESQVLRGENAGKKLAHTSVVRSLKKLGALREGDTFAQDIRLILESGLDPRNLRLVAFAQAPHQGRIVGATRQSLDAATGQARAQ